jgi:hypothetical protein
MGNNKMFFNIPLWQVFKTVKQQQQQKLLTSLNI